MKLTIFSLVMILVFAQPAFSKDPFLEHFWESNNAYQAGQYLETKVALMKATSALDVILSEALERGDITFEKFRSIFDELTDVQFKELRGELKDKKVTWSGYLDDVKEKWLGGFEIQIDMDPPETFLSVYDVSLTVSSDMEDFVSTLTKNKQVKFQGKIKSIQKILGKLVVNIKDVNFVD